MVSSRWLKKSGVEYLLLKVVAEESEGKRSVAVAEAEEGVAAAAEAAGPFPHEDGKEEKSRLTREIFQD